MSIAVFPASHKSRRNELAAYLREMADHIERDEAICEPHAVLICLTGPTQHEVVHFGYHTDHEGFRGAISAMRAVVEARFRTLGGNVRSRDARIYGAPSMQKIANLIEKIRTKGSADDQA